MKRKGLSLLLLLALGVNGCWFGKKHKPPAAPPPPAVAPHPAPVIKPEIKPDSSPDTKFETPPEIKPETTPVEALPLPPEQKPATKPPAKRPRKAVQPVVPAPPAAPASAPSIAPPAPTTVAVPQLSVLLTPEQHSQYEADYARNLARAQDGLARSAEHSLSPAQRESVSRIRSFMHQAEELHGRDLATAAQLAQRAAVLAQDLADSLH